MNTRIPGWVGLGALLLAGAALSGDAPQGAAGDVRGDLRRSLQALWRAHVGPLPATNEAGTLQEQAERLRMLGLRPKEPAVGSAAASLPAAPPEQVLGEPARAGTTAPAGSGISPAVLERLTKLAPEGIASQEGLATALFRSGESGAAYVFYERALQKAQSPAEKEWLLYQMANCRDGSDPAAAAALYKRLLAESPDSLWSGLADVQARLIEWNQINDPRGLLKQVRGQLTGGAPTTRPAPATQPGESP